MDHARKKLLGLFLIVLTLSACSPKPGVQAVKILENQYANLYVNNEKQKREAIEDLRVFFQTHEFNDQNLREIRKAIHKLNDGHVVIFDSRPEKNIRYKSGIEFIPGSNQIESCDTCTPAISKDKYEILEVNSLPFRNFLEKDKYSVAASTPWGRNHRVAHHLALRLYREEATLRLKSSSGKIFFTKINWKPFPPQTPTCVAGERLKENVYKLTISELWCEDPNAKPAWSREQIYDNFKKQFDDAVAPITPSDKIVIDLRENGGGGDLEVEYVLNAFNEKSVFMYHYRYLRKTHPGKRKWLEKFVPFKLGLWSEDEYQYTDLNHRPKKLFFDNKLVTLISPGCFSSCETIASVLKLEKRSLVLGTKTHGGSGDPVIFPIKGTPYSLNIPTCVTWQKNEKFYEGVGVLPDEELLQNPATKDDNVLMTAIDRVQ